MKRVALAVSSLLLPLMAEGSARACGGAFFEDPTTVHVSAHRMAIALSADQTIVWDQIQYQGDPKDFAFVFPVPPGSTVELGDDAWLTALDAYTSPVIYAPRDSSSGGCALMGCATTENTTAGSASARGDGPKTALAVGPYLVSTVTPKTAADLLSTFTQAGLVVPAGADAIVSSYLAEGMSFVVMRLRPGCGEQSIVPIRIVMPGSHPVVPLRLASIGATAPMDVEIFVLGDERWAPQSYPEGFIDFSTLRADSVANNYEALASAVFAGGDGRSFLTELAGPATAVSISQTDLRSTVASLCAQAPTAPNGSACAGDTGDAAADPFFDAAASDASDHGSTREGGSGEPSEAGDGGDVDGGGDDGGDGSVMMFAPKVPFGRLSPLDNGITMQACSEPSDLTRTTEHTPYEKLYLTRLRARIPLARIAKADLTLRPWTASDSGGATSDVSQYHQALATPTGEEPRSNPSAACGAAGRSSRPRADLAAALATVAFVFAGILRRRKK